MRLRGFGERGRGRDPLGLELADLRAPAAGDEREVVDLLPPGSGREGGTRRSSSGRTASRSSRAGRRRTPRAASGRAARRPRTPAGETTPARPSRAARGSAPARGPGDVPAAPSRSRAGGCTPASRSGRASCRPPRRSRSPAARGSRPRRASRRLQGRPGRRRRRPSGSPPRSPARRAPSRGRARARSRRRVFPSARRRSRYAASCSRPLRKTSSACSPGAGFSSSPRATLSSKRRQVRAGEVGRDVARREQELTVMQCAPTPSISAPHGVVLTITIACTCSSSTSRAARRAALLRARRRRATRPDWPRCGPLAGDARRARLAARTARSSGTASARARCHPRSPTPSWRRSPERRSLLRTLLDIELGLRDGARVLRQRRGHVRDRADVPRRALPAPARGEPTIVGLIVVDSRFREDDARLRRFFADLQKDGTPYSRLDRIVEGLFLGPSPLLDRPPVRRPRRRDHRRRRARHRAGDAATCAPSPRFARHPATGAIDGVGLKRFPEREPRQRDHHRLF